MQNTHLWQNAKMLNSVPMDPNKPPTLAQAEAGQRVTIKGFANLAADYRQHLQAYGLLPGRAVRVLAQRPVTIVLVEQTELAFESEISSKVLVE